MEYKCSKCGSKEVEVSKHLDANEVIGALLKVFNLPPDPKQSNDLPPSMVDDKVQKMRQNHADAR